MKKRYFAPETIQTMLHTKTTLLAGSNPNVTYDRSLNVNAEDVESREIYYPKNYNVWDD